MADWRRARCSVLLLSRPCREHPRGRSPTDAAERAPHLEKSLSRSTASFRTSRPKTDLLFSHYQLHLAILYTEEHSANISIATALHTHFRYQYFKHCIHAKNACSLLNCLLSQYPCSVALRRGHVLTQQGGRVSLWGNRGERCHNAVVD